MTDLLTSKELAAALKRSLDYVYAMRKAGFPMPGKRATLAAALVWLSDNPSPTGRLKSGSPTKSA
jgi:hypothetical protein